MRFVSPVLKRVVYPALSTVGYLHRHANRAPLTVVTYHGVLPTGYAVTDFQLDGPWVSPDAFRRQLRFPRSRYNVINFGGGFRRGTSWFGIPRVHISLDTTESEFEAHVSGLHEDLRRRFGRMAQIPAA